MKIQRGFIVPLVVILLAVLGAGSYVVVKNKNFIKQKEITKTKETGGMQKNGPTSIAVGEINGLKTYKNEQYRFEITLPTGWKSGDELAGAETIIFSSPDNQIVNDAYRKGCGNGECMGAFYPRGIYFATLPVHQSWLPVSEERGVTKIEGISWTVKVYDRSGLGTMAYETTIGNRSYVFWQYLSDSNKNEFQQLLSNFKPF